MPLGPQGPLAPRPPGRAQYTTKAQAPRPSIPNLLHVTTASTAFLLLHVNVELTVEGAVDAALLDMVLPEAMLQTATCALLLIDAEERAVEVAVSMTRREIVLLTFALLRHRERPARDGMVRRVAVSPEPSPKGFSARRTQTNPTESSGMRNWALPRAGGHKVPWGLRAT